MLSSIYGYAKYAYVGGGVRGALHNTLEASVYGIPVFVARNEKNKKFKEVEEQEREGILFQLDSATDLLQIIQTFEGSKTTYDEVSRTSKAFFDKKSGATEKVLNHIDGLL
jgi:3-deoxy-D-manno-octulosonic-acid transferase